MSDASPSKFMELDSSRTSEHLRIRRLSKLVRAYFEGLDIHERFALFSQPPFFGLVSPGETEPDREGNTRKRSMPRPPEYPTQKDHETPGAFRQRIEKFHADNAAYKKFAQEYSDEGVEAVLQVIEKLDSRGEFWHQPKESSLQKAEALLQRCTVPVFAAILLDRPYEALLPPAPTAPPRTQLSLF